MEDQHLKKLIKTYLDGNATPAEQFIVESWLESFQQDSHQETQISDTIVYPHNNGQS